MFEEFVQRSMGGMDALRGPLLVGGEMCNANGRAGLFLFLLSRPTEPRAILSDSTCTTRMRVTLRRSIYVGHPLLVVLMALWLSAAVGLDAPAAQRVVTPAANEVDNASTVPAAADVSAETLSPTPMPLTTALDSGCSSCEKGWLTGPSSPLGSRGGECVSCGNSCVPGQSSCSACVSDTRIGRFACEVYRALCCPDPCYEPQWKPLADSAFFVEAVRPVTQQRLRWDAGLGMVHADRAEYFWARADGTSIGPSADAPWLAVRSLDYHDLSMYTETSSGKFSMFINQPYRSVYPTDTGHSAGFAPMDLGTKTLLFDCELLQVAFQFRTYLPIGNTRKGLGNGHTSLEPSLIIGLALSPETYLQGQIAEWIPIGGNREYAGALLHYHLSVNRTLWRLMPDVPVIGTLEMNGWSFQDGAYTDPVLGTQPASGETYLSIGPGIRMSVCDKVDFGVGTAFALTSDHFAEQLIRSEFRFRY